MIRDRFIAKFIKYGGFFRAYADCKYLKRRVLAGHMEDRSVRTDSLCGIRSLSSMMRYVHERGAKVYGEELIDSYDRGAENTILLVSHELSLTGAPIVLLNLALALRKKGRQTVMIAPQDGKLGEYAAEHGVPVIVYTDLLESDFVYNVRWLFAAVVANTIICSRVVVSLKGTDTPVLWWIHEAALVYTREVADMLPRKLTDNILVCCVGSYARRLLTARFPKYKAGSLIYYVKDTEGSVPSLLPRKDMRRRYVCVGSVEWRKGQDDLLEAIRLLPDEVRRNCHFVLAGRISDNKIGDNILAMQAEHPELITYRGVLGPDEIFDIYRESDFIVCPSRDDPMPVVATEAMSLGKPVICTRSTGTADIVRRYGAGYTCRRGDPRRLAELISESFCMTEEEYDRMSVNARRAYEEVFSEQVFEQNVDTVIEKLLRRQM